MQNYNSADERMTEYEAHPIADLFPMMSDEEIANQAEDIKKHGLLHPILLFEGKILDGRNRYKSCKRAGVEPRFETFTGTFTEALQRVWSENVQRRHLTSFQCAAIVVAQDELVARIEAEARERRLSELKQYREDDTVTQTFEERIDDTVSQKIDSRSDEIVEWDDQPEPQPEPVLTPTKPKPSRNEQTSDAILAQAAGTNRQYVNEAKKIKKKAPEVLAMVQKGEISRDDAKKITNLDDEVRKKTIREIEMGINPKKAIQKARTDTYKQKEQKIIDDLARPIINQESYKTWLNNQPLCDLLITDPPYMTDVDDVETFAKEWLPLALSRIKPTGRAYICIGAYPDELAAYITASKQSDMILAQILVWTYRNTLGPRPSHDYKQNWQAILYFRGEDAGKLDCPLMIEQFSVQDINAPDGRIGNRYHKWQKPDELAERLIRHSTKKGDIILDPFAGTGTFLLAAARMERVAFGCDNDPEILKIAEERGCQIE